MVRINICRSCDVIVGSEMNIHAYDNAGLCPVCEKRETFANETSVYMIVHLEGNKVVAIASLDVIAGTVDADYAKILTDAGWDFKEVLAPYLEPDYGQDYDREFVTLAWKNFAIDFTLTNHLSGSVLRVVGQNKEAFEEANEIFQTGSDSLFRWAEMVPKNPKWEAVKEAIEREKKEQRERLQELNDLPF